MRISPSTLEATANHRVIKIKEKRVGRKRRRRSKNQKKFSFNKMWWSREREQIHESKPIFFYQMHEDDVVVFHLKMNLFFNASEKMMQYFSFRNNFVEPCVTF